MVWGHFSSISTTHISSGFLSPEQLVSKSWMWCIQTVYASQISCPHPYITTGPLYHCQRRRIAAICRVFLFTLLNPKRTRMTYASAILQTIANHKLRSLIRELTTILFWLLICWLLPKIKKSHDISRLAGIIPWYIPCNIYIYIYI